MHDLIDALRRPGRFLRRRLIVERERTARRAGRSATPSPSLGDEQPRDFDLLLVPASRHVEIAAYAVEIADCVHRAWGPMEVALGFNPRPVLLVPPTRPADHERSYYWRRHLATPQFVSLHPPGMAALLRAVLRAAASTVAALANALAGGLRAGALVGGFARLQDLSVRGIVVGPFVLSEYLQNRTHSQGRLRADAALVWTLLRCMFYLHFWLNAWPGRDFRRCLFTITETTYHHEILRRALLARGATEVIPDRWRSGALRLSSTHADGLLTMLAQPSSGSPSADRLAAARDRLRRRLRGGRIASLWSDVEAGLRARLPAGASNSVPRTAVVFLHVVSDSQHWLGEDCFVDLHDWLLTTLALLREQQVRVLLKLHPCYHATPYVPDVRYQQFLEQQLGVSWNDLEPGGMKATREPEVFIVDRRLGLQALTDTLGSFLCVTHHGSVALEAASLRLPLVLAAASPFRNFEPFGAVYRSVEEYRTLVEAWARGELAVDEGWEANAVRYLADTADDHWNLALEHYQRVSCLTDPLEAAVAAVLSVDPRVDPDAHAIVRQAFCRAPEVHPS